MKIEEDIEMEQDKEEKKAYEHEKALEEMEARVEETVDHFYDQGEAGKLRVRQEFRDLYG